MKSILFLNSLPTLQAFNLDICKIIISVKTISYKIKKDALHNNIYAPRNVFFFFFFFEIGKNSGNQSPLPQVIDIVNGMHLFRVRAIIFHCSTLSL